MSGNNSRGPAVKTFTVDAAPGGKAKDYRFDVGDVGAGLPMPTYLKKKYRFTATGSSTTLTFASTTPEGQHGFGAVLDDVSTCGTPPKSDPPAPPESPSSTPDVPVKINSGGGPIAGSDPTVPLVGVVALVAVAGAGFVVSRRRRTREQR